MDVRASDSSLVNAYLLEFDGSRAQLLGKSEATTYRVTCS